MKIGRGIKNVRIFRSPSHARIFEGREQYLDLRKVRALHGVGRPIQQEKCIAE